MTKFKVSHTFTGISRAEYEQLYFDEPFNIALCDAVRLARDLRKIERDDVKIHRVVAVGPDREIPKPLQKVMKTPRLDYEERLDYTFGSFHGTWETVPSVMANKVETKGTFQFDETSGGVIRVVSGNIKVKVMGIGGMVEKFIIADVEKSYADAARFTQEWIDGEKHKTSG